MALQLQDFAERYTAAWCSHDAARVAAFFSPNGSLKINDAPAAVGREAITEVASGFMRTFPDLKVLMDGLSSEKGARCLSMDADRHSSRCKTGNGNRVHISGYEEWRIGSDGLIAESLGHFDKRSINGSFKGENCAPREC